MKLSKQQVEVLASKLYNQQEERIKSEIDFLLENEKENLHKEATRISELCKQIPKDFLFYNSATYDTILDTLQKSLKQDYKNSVWHKRKSEFESDIVLATIDAKDLNELYEKLWIVPNQQ